MSKNSFPIWLLYTPSPTVEILPLAIAALQQAVPSGKVVLHDRSSSDELVVGLQNATLELAIMVQTKGEQTTGIEFELLSTSIVIARVTKGDVTPVGEKFSEILRIIARAESESDYERILGTSVCFDPC